jgi:hypothetical protein
MKVVVLDLDETVGAFTTLFRDLKDVSPLISAPLFAEVVRGAAYFRPGMIELLRFLRNNRRLNLCKVVIYTNISSVEWLNLILNYISQQIGAGWIDCVLYRNHPRRRTVEKTLKDLRHGAKLPKESTIFFVDDQVHEKMVDADVTYLQVPPYSVGSDGEGTCRQLMKSLLSFLHEAEGAHQEQGKHGRSNHKGNVLGKGA